MFRIPRGDTFCPTRKGNQAPKGDSKCAQITGSEDLQDIGDDGFFKRTLETGANEVSFYDKVHNDTQLVYSPHNSTVSLLLRTNPADVILRAIKNSFAPLDRKGPYAWCSSDADAKIQSGTYDPQTAFANVKITRNILRDGTILTFYRQIPTLQRTIRHQVFAPIIRWQPQQGQEFRATVISQLSTSLNSKCSSSS
jgi:hypothetical protein